MKTVCDRVFFERPAALRSLDNMGDLALFLEEVDHRLVAIEESQVVMAVSLDKVKGQLRKIERKERAWVRAEAKSEARCFVERLMKEARQEFAHDRNALREWAKQDMAKLWDSMKALNRDHEYNRNMMHEFKAELGAFSEKTLKFVLKAE